MNYYKDNAIILRLFNFFILIYNTYQKQEENYLILGINQKQYCCYQFIILILIVLSHNKSLLTITLYFGKQLSILDFNANQNNEFLIRN